MATAISHIIYAKKYLEKYPSALNKDEFIFGAVFPDVQIIDEKIKRSDTHCKFEPLDLNFDGLTSFQAGWKFHLYCDMRREEILNEAAFFSIEGSDAMHGRANKFLEDELIYHTYNNWEKLSAYFNHPPTLTTEMAITPETIDLWYALVSRYVEKAPDEKALRSFISKTYFRKNNTDAIISAVDHLRKNKKAVEILRTIEEKII
jgi:hypothetical protein